MLCSLGCGEPGTGGGETDANTTAQTLDPVVLEWAAAPEVLTYPRQPMVVDIRLSFTAPATVKVTHSEDPGVRFSAAPGHASDGWSMQQVVRVRGLRPDQTHLLTATATGEDGSTLVPREISLTSEPARPGFLPLFPVTVPETGNVADDAYRLFDLISFLPGGGINGAYAIDRFGVTRWYLDAFGPAKGPSSLWAGLAVRADGTLQFAVDGEVYIADELGTILHLATAESLDLPFVHHDLIELPNGHLVAIGASYRTIDYGEDGLLTVAGDTLVEFSFTGPETTDVHWRWDSFDHLDPQRRRPGFEIEVEGPSPGTVAQDWTHANGVVYRPEDDSLLLSLRHQDWLVNIDHETGEIRWKLGAEGDFELVEGTWFYHQHSPEWQSDGSILMYDNGLANPDVSDADEASRAARYHLDTGAMTARRVWEDDGVAQMSALAGDADQLANGHILALDSVTLLDAQSQLTGAHSRIRELDPGATPMQVWAVHTPPEKFAYRARASTRLPGEVAATP